MSLVPRNAEDTCLKNHPLSRNPSRAYSEKLGEDSHGLVSPENAHIEAATQACGNGALASAVAFPEGGTEAWLVVVGSFCAMLSVFGLINTAAVFESWFSTHQLAAFSPSEIGWVFSLYLFVVFFVGIQVGPVFDRYGARWLVACGSALMVASLLLLGFCEGE